MGFCAYVLSLCCSNEESLRAKERATMAKNSRRHVTDGVSEDTEQTAEHKRPPVPKPVARQRSAPQQFLIYFLILFFLLRFLQRLYKFVGHMYGTNSEGTIKESEFM